ncbi:DEK protein, partial [Ostertagia ostertagi]
DSDDDTSSSTSVETHEESKPTDKELEDVIEELLSQVDLSQVSMKQMCQAVIEKFPGTNIATRVDYLKSKIKQSLSTK